MAGQGDTPIYEEVLKLKKSVTDVVIQNKNNVTLRLGCDRPPDGSDYKKDGLLSDGEPETGTLDVTTGRIGRDPNYDTDKSRIYVSSKTDGDTNFGLTSEGFLSSTDTEQTSDGNAYVITKSDSIRIIARENVRIQNQDNGASITMKSNGDIIIHTPEKIKIGSENASEALVLGEQFLSFMGQVLESLSSLQSTLMNHAHPSPAGPTGPPIQNFVNDLADLKMDFNDRLNEVTGRDLVSDSVFTQKRN